MLQEDIESGKEKVIYVLTGSGIVHHLFAKNKTIDYINIGQNAIDILDRIASFTKVSWIEETPANYSTYGIDNSKIDLYIFIAKKVQKGMLKYSLLILLCYSFSKKNELLN